MKWLKTEVDLGNVVVGSSHQIKFEYEGEITIAKNNWGGNDIVVSCGCISVTPKPDLHLMLIKYTPNKIPKHLKMEGKTSYHSRKTATIKYIDDDNQVQKQTLIIKSFVTEK